MELSSKLVVISDYVLSWAIYSKDQGERGFSDDCLSNQIFGASEVDSPAFIAFNSHWRKIEAGIFFAQEEGNFHVWDWVLSLEKHRHSV